MIVTQESCITLQMQEKKKLIMTTCLIKILAKEVSICVTIISRYKHTILPCNGKCIKESQILY